MPNHTITRGIIATGGNDLKTLSKGDNDLSNAFILPVNSPKDIPAKLPKKMPANALQRLDLIWINNSPEFKSSTNAKKTDVGGGNKVLLTIPLSDKISHSKINAMIGIVQ